MARGKVCVVIGAGDATGGAIARRFAREGYTAVVTRRSADKLKHLVAQITEEGGRVHPFGSDARDEEQVHELFREIETEIGEVEVFVFNIGGNVRFDIRDTTSRVYRKVWEMTAFAGFLTAREAAKAMVPRGRGTMLFTGATASLRGGRGFSAFAGGKHAVRALAQSMARELGPQNIHVAHVVIDGAIDTEWIKANFPERYNAGPDAILNPDTSPRPTGSSTSRSGRPGPSRWISGRGRRRGELVARCRRSTHAGADRGADQRAGQDAEGCQGADDGARAGADAAAGDRALAPGIAAGRGAEEDGGQDQIFRHVKRPRLDIGLSFTYRRRLRAVA